MKAALNKTEEYAFHFISAHFSTEGHMPAQREVLRALGYGQSSFNVAARLLKRLVEAGLLRRSRFHRGYELVKTEYQIPADCSCGVCANARYFAQLQLVQGLSVPAPKPLIPKLRGLKPLSERTKVFWRDGFPSPPVCGVA